MIKEFEVKIKRITDDWVILLINKEKKEVKFPREYLPASIKEGSLVYFSASSKKFSHTVDLLNHLLGNSDE